MGILTQLEEDHCGAAVLAYGDFFAGGDAVTGPASVIGAIAAGRLAASSIDKYLGGSGVIDEILAPLEETNGWLGKEEGFADRRGAEMPSLTLEERLGGFAEVECGFTTETAQKEAARCLRCDLRLKITPAMLAPMRERELVMAERAG